MTCCKLLRYDLRHGLFRPSLMAIPLLFAAECIPCVLMASVVSPKAATFTVMDYCLYCFRGIERIPALYSLEQLQLPLLWLAAMGLCPLLNLMYPLRDISHFGQQVITRGGSRIRWWLSKCAWNVLSCITYYVLALLTIVGVALLAGATPSLSASLGFLEIYYSALSSALPAQNLLLRTILLLPLLALVELSMLEMVLSLFVKPTFSFLACMAVLVASVYFFSPVLPGNYAMLLRSDLFCAEGLMLNAALWISIAAIAAIVIGGAAFFKHWDILNLD